MRLLTLTVTLLVVLVVPAAAQARDRDRDKLPDRWEKRYHISTKKKSGNGDPDRDGLSNLGEYRSKTSPRRTDTDRDNIRDDDEDPDRDRVDNDNEAREGTMPRDRDSDDDRRRDGREDRDRDGLTNADEDLTGNDPRDRDSDDDGVSDGAEQAGVVTSFTAGLLTIDLANGTSVTRLVVDGVTEIECQSENWLEGFQSGRVGTTTPRRASAAQEDAGDGDPADDPDPGDDPGEDPGDDGTGDDPAGDDGTDADSGGSVTCSAAELVPGTRVHEAETRALLGTLVFTRLELLK